MNTFEERNSGGVSSVAPVVAGAYRVELLLQEVLAE